MTNIKIIDDREKTIHKQDAEGTYSKSNGGTEMMDRKLKANIDARLLSKFNIVKSRITDEMASLLDDKETINLFWAHDTVHDPEAQKLKDVKLQEKFAKFIFVSDWQKQQYQDYLKIPPSKCVVMRNAIQVPFASDVELKKRFTKFKTVRMVYHTTPHRGLELLVPVFEKIAETEDVHLDVFSSFEVYGWKEKDKPYESLFKRIEDHPKMTYHGYQKNEVVLDALHKAHIFPFPSMWPETSCIAMIEAMMCGVHCIFPNYAALPETSGGFGTTYQFHENPHAHANIFLVNLMNRIDWFNRTRDQARNRISPLFEHSKFQRDWAKLNYTWAFRQVEWEKLLQSMVPST